MTGSAITWVELTDDDDNTYWQGVSPYTDGDTPMLWRIRMALAGGKIVYENDHTPELRSETSPVWYTLADAKSDCQVAHDDIIREAFGGNPPAAKPPVPDLEWELIGVGRFSQLSKCRQYGISIMSGCVKWAHVTSESWNDTSSVAEAIRQCKIGRAHV